jgi:tetratricopeptide (TPR) repeat protein
MKILATLFFLLFSYKVMPCGNTYHDEYGKEKGLYSSENIINNLKDLAIRYTPDILDNLIIGFEKEKLQLQKLLLENELKLKPNNFKLKSDLALLELKIGDKQKALLTFEELYKAYPDEYNIIGNLGTAYEVTGNNKKALEFITKAIEMNPNSHQGSEWIHKRILEEKLKSVTSTSKIINLTKGKSFIHWFVNDKTPTADLEKLSTHLSYQLKERMAFINPPNEIVAILLIDLGDIQYKLGFKEKAFEYYDKAAIYEPMFADKTSVRKNLTSLKLFLYQYNSLLFIVAAVFTLLLARWVYKKSKKKPTTNHTI